MCQVHGLLNPDSPTSKVEAEVPLLQKFREARLESALEGVARRNEPEGCRAGSYGL